MGTDEYRHWHISDNSLLLGMALDITKKYNFYPCTYSPLSKWVPDPDLEGQYYDLHIPCIQAVGKPIWFHSAEDTPEKLRPEQIYRSYRGHLELARRLLAADPAEVRARDRMPHKKVMEEFLPKETRKAVVGQDDRGVFFDFSPQPAMVGETVLFYINTCVNPDAATLKFTFDFGDGTTWEDICVTHAYSKPGRYTVSVTGVDEKGYEFTSSRAIWVKPVPAAEKGELQK